MAPPPGIKTSHPHHPNVNHHEDAETFTHEPTTTTMKEAVTMVMNTMTSAVQETLVPSPGGADSNTNNILPPNDGGANEMTNSTNTDIVRMFTSSTGTSFEQVTTDIATTLMDGMEQMEHVDESDDYNIVLFIVLGVVLGVLVVVAVVLGVVYNHYRKRGFTEISGEHSQVDPQSMKQLQQAGSQDALLDK